LIFDFQIKLLLFVEFSYNPFFHDINNQSIAGGYFFAACRSDLTAGSIPAEGAADFPPMQRSRI
jgi:hypothetical protein